MKAKKKMPVFKPEPPTAFCTLSFEVGELKFTASGPEDYVNREKRWFMEAAKNVRYQEEEPGSDPDAG